MSVHVKQQIVIVDLLASIVSRVQADYRVLKGNNALTVTYMHGPVEEIEANLVEIAKAQGLPGYTGAKKYPLIAVFQDFPEVHNPAGGYYADVNLPIVLIANLTSNTYKADKRYAENFKPILYPLYELFLQQMAKQPEIVGKDPNLFDHTKFDRLYYGKRSLGTQVSDYVDAIEIQNLKFTVNQNC